MWLRDGRRLDSGAGDVCGAVHWDLFKNRYEQDQTFKGKEENLALLARNATELF